MQAFLKTGKLGGPVESTSKKASTSKAREPKPPAKTPWVEKYRPQTVEDVVEQAEVVQVLKQCLGGGDFPNLLLYGPPGTGKTSTILAAAKQLFSSNYKNRILELNASDERGIQVIRDKVKTFAQLSVSNTTAQGKSCPSFKIIILDEADSMTHAAQSALRRTMEKECQSTRFCLICNYVSRIIEPLTSRCTKFRFKPLGREKLIERLQYICKQENVAADMFVLAKLVDASGGDLRRAITSLQSVSRLKIDGEVNLNDILHVTGVVPDDWVERLLKACESRNYTEVESYVDDFLLEGFAVSQLVDQLAERIVYSDFLLDTQKSIIGHKLGEVAYRLLDGGSEYLQLMDLSYGIIQAYNLPDPPSN